MVVEPGDLSASRWHPSDWKPEIAPEKPPLKRYFASVSEVVIAFEFFSVATLLSLFDGLKVKRFTLLSIVLPNYFSKIFHQKPNPLKINKKSPAPDTHQDRATPKNQMKTICGGDGIRTRICTAY